MDLVQEAQNRAGAFVPEFPSDIQGERRAEIARRMSQQLDQQSKQEFLATLNAAKRNIDAEFAGEFDEVLTADRRAKLALPVKVLAQPIAK